MQALSALPLDYFPGSLCVNEAKYRRKSRNGSALLTFVLPSILAEQPYLPCRQASFKRQALCAKPRILQKIPCRWSVPWVQFHHSRDEVPVRPCQFFVFGHTEREPILVRLSVDNRTRADCEAFRVRDFLETVIERPEAPDLLNKHPKPVMFIVKGNICWPKDMTVSAEYQTDQPRRSV